MSTDQANSYDEIPYSDNCFPHSHADYLSVVGGLYGLGTPPAGRCRVLELGCAGGGNLIPQAMEFPGSEFVGIDLSRRQVEAGRAVVRRLGLGNVELRSMSLADVGRDFGRFDYILCHGVYSWVPEGVRDKILAICAENLAPDGVAYVSYNTYPGWHARGMVREMLAFHVRSAASALDRVRLARAFLEELVRVLPNPSSAYARILRTEGEFLRGVANSYLFHEHLEETNHPVYFREFAERAAAEGLRFLAEARTPGLIDLLGPEAQGLLDRWSDDPIAREQYGDFLCNRTFRRSLLCHADREASRVPASDPIDALWLSTALQPAAEGPDLGSDAVEEFRSPDGRGTLSTGSPALKAALVVLREAFPQAVPFAALRERVQTILGAGPAATQARDEGPGPLRDAMLRAFLSNLVDLQVQPLPLATAAGDRPSASPLARIQAEEGERLTNLRRRSVELPEFDRLVLRQLDGRRDRAEVLAALMDLAASDEFTIYEGGEPVRDLARVETMLGSELDPCLGRLARLALLAG